jgi:hypothetical protein
MTGGIVMVNLKTIERPKDASFATQVPAALAAFGRKVMVDFANTQTELLDKQQKTNREWFDRMQSEANLASDLGSKLTAARSIPDMMTAWQFWAARRAEMMADDRTHLLTNYQMFADTLAQAASKAWRPDDSRKQT